MGFKAGVYRAQHFSGGLYAAYRTDYRDIVVGAEGVISHFPWARTEVGFNAEQRIATFQDGRDTAFRGSVYGRYVLQYGSSLYLPPMHYLEGFALYSDNFLPFVKSGVPTLLRTPLALHGATLAT